MNFHIWHYWFIAAFFFFLLEIFIPGFIMGSIGLGCLIAAFGAFMQLPLWFNIILFIAGFFIGITMLKPLLKRMEKTGDIKTNVDGMIGKKGKVIETIDPEQGYGWVRIDGDDWKAISANNRKIASGTAVEVVAIESIVLTVRQLNTEHIDTEKATKTVAQTLSSNTGLILSLGNKKEIVQHTDILCFYSTQKTTYLITAEGKQKMVDESLEKLEEKLGNEKFFRANRQFIISSLVVKLYKTLPDGKIEVTLKPLQNLPSDISVSRLKAHAFRKWIEKQV
ncbi:MAG TPA: NfeD family protein [Prolixibacteraceae bacterium]|nr:NfeD family protein [Prolixibacteraceae bacterium]